jgi:hypothetical protein
MPQLTVDDLKAIFATAKIVPKKIQACSAPNKKSGSA